MFLFTAAGFVFALPVSDVLNDGQGDFDPWNQTRWSAWYENGKIVHYFEIDCSLTFASRTTDWEVDLSELEGSLPRLFIIDDNESIIINGNGVVIDARLEHTKSWSLQYLYTNYVSTTEDFGSWRAFLFRQNGDTPEGDEGSLLYDITLKGFLNAIEYDHSHNRKVTINNCNLIRNVWGVFPRGANGSVTNCTLSENHLGGFYCEYNSHNWTISNNTFKDNNIRGAVSYGDIVLDACYGNTISDNQFLASSYTPRDYHTAISLYRNRGESGDIREYASKDHVMERNTFDSYHIAIDFSPREAMEGNNDQSGEYRCYTNDNTVKDCTFTDCNIGICVRSHFNIFDSNTFTNVEKDIVLFNLFYKLINNAITNQPGTNVYLWSKASDYSGYEDYVPYGMGVGSAIGESDKLYFIISDGSAAINGGDLEQVIVSDSLLIPDPGDFNEDMAIDETDLESFCSYWLNEDCVNSPQCVFADIDKNNLINIFDYSNFAGRWGLGNDLQNAYSAGGEPVDVAVGDFAYYLEGDEIAVIWDQPISDINGTEYYSIIIYDAKGLELDRCGRSTKRWSKIAAGNFIEDTGYIQVDENYEIAAVSSEADENGYYPVYVFRKGWLDPSVSMLTSNIYPVADITSGNFETSIDDYDELAVIFANTDTNIEFVKPSSTQWSSQTTNSVFLNSIAAGNFDWITGVDEVAADLRADPSTKLVAAWDFEDTLGGVLKDKAPAGDAADDLEILGQIAIADGVATISYQNQAALRAADSQDLDLKKSFTIWVRAKVVNEPVGYVSLVDKRQFSSPEQRSYVFLINHPSTTASGSVPGFFGIGGQISEDGDNGDNSFADTDGSEMIQTGVMVELVMLCEARGDLHVKWLASTVSDPSDSSQWQVVNEETYNENVESIFNSSVDLYIGNNLNLDNPLATIDYDEVRIYNDALTVEELADIEPSQPQNVAITSYPIYMYKVGASGSYGVTASANDIPLAAVSGGNFDGGGLPKDEIAVAAAVAEDGVYPIRYYSAGASSPFKVGSYNAMNIKPLAFDNGDFTVSEELTVYESCQGEDCDTVNSWGDFLLVFPSNPEIDSYRPLYWLNCNTSSSTYHRTVPVLR